jgi:Xaa-Pro dipeptidase
MNRTYEQRLKKLARAQREGQVDFLAIAPGANLRYLAGLVMHPSERITLALFPTEGQTILVLPGLEAPRAQASLQIEASLYTYTDQEGADAAFQRAIGDLGLRGGTIGVEHLHMRVLELRQLERQITDCHFVDADPLLSRLRIIKDDEEIKAMRRAAEANEVAFREVMDQIRPGVTELALARAWQKAALEADGEELPEAPIVASGPYGASPHTAATSRRLEKGDLVTIDGFLRCQGYYSDITRTYAVGEIDTELELIYSLVLGANEAARQLIAPGINAQEVDAAARRVIEKGGYDEYFIHRTGHGLGLEIHEPPYIVEGNDLTLQPGMTFTVEPGIYLPGRGGARIEDNVLVTEDGCESLTTLPRELIRL